jgi:hypothetical protein
VSPEADIYPLGAPSNPRDVDHVQRVLHCMTDCPDDPLWIVITSHRFRDPKAEWLEASPNGVSGYAFTSLSNGGAVPLYAPWADANPQESYERLLTAGLLPEFRFPTEFCRCKYNVGHRLWGPPIPDHRSLFILALHTPAQIRTLEALIEAFVLGPCDGTIDTIVLCIGQDTSRHATSKRWLGLDHQYMRMEYDLRSRGLVMELVEETQPRTYRVHASLRTPLFLR